MAGLEPDGWSCDSGGSIPSAAVASREGSGCRPYSSVDTECEASSTALRDPALARGREQEMAKPVEDGNCHCIRRMR